MHEHKNIELQINIASEIQRNSVLPDEKKKRPVLRLHFEKKKKKDSKNLFMNTLKVLNC